MLPPPFTSTPRPISILAPVDAEQRPEDAATFWRSAEDPEDDEMDVEDVVQQDDDEDVDIDDEAEVTGEEEVQDMMAVEDEETRRDTIGLEERRMGPELTD